MHPGVSWIVTKRNRRKQYARTSHGVQRSFTSLICSTDAILNQEYAAYHKYKCFVSRLATKWEKSYSLEAWVQVLSFSLFAQSTFVSAKLAATLAWPCKTVLVSALATDFSHTFSWRYGLPCLFLSSSDFFALLSCQYLWQHAHPRTVHSNSFITQTHTHTHAHTRAHARTQTHVRQFLEAFCGCASYTLNVGSFSRGCYSKVFHLDLFSTRGISLQLYNNLINKKEISSATHFLQPPAIGEGHVKYKKCV